MSSRLLGSFWALAVVGLAAAAGQEQDAVMYLKRGQTLEGQKKYADAVAAYGKAIELDARLADAYQLRGGAKFKQGDVAGSIADFDKYIELQPKAKISHWQRGISCYYAGKFADGKKQFEGYQEYDSEDVENGVWRYLCHAKIDGTAKARSAMLPIGPDKRVPMKEIYELFRGKLKPADVLAAAEAGKPPADQRNQRLFYAHLYLGLYYDSEADRTRALEHLAKAVDDCPVGHYMWDVARVHRDILRRDLKK